MQNNTTCRDECPNSQYCWNKPCPKSGDYMECCDYWHLEELREDARWDEIDRDDYDEEEDEDDDE